MGVLQGTKNSLEKALSEKKMAQELIAAYPEEAKYKIRLADINRRIKLYRTWIKNYEKEKAAGYKKPATVRWRKK